MGDKSKIQWTEATWNPTRGCSLVSPGCTNCYAMGIAHRFSGEGGTYEGLTRISGGRPKWTGEVRLHPEKLDQPLRWRKPRRIFVDSMSDLFHPDVPFSYIDQVFAVMALADSHTFQILTKRPERMVEYFDHNPLGMMSHVTHARVARVAETVASQVLGERTDSAWWDVWLERWPLANVWLGTSVEDQQRADERIPHLLRTPAAVRFLSCEPLLGPVDLRAMPISDGSRWRVTDTLEGLQWIIVGGESGPHARPCNVAWIRSIRDQCRAAGVPVFVKQLGARPVRPDGVFHAGEEKIRPRSMAAYDRLLRDSHGGDPDEWPEDLRVREFPA